MNRTHLKYLGNRISIAKYSLNLPNIRKRASMTVGSKSDSSYFETKFFSTEVLAQV